MQMDAPASAEAPERLNQPPEWLRNSRCTFHAALLEQVLRANDVGIPSNADGSNQTSVGIAAGILVRLGAEAVGARLAGQMSGNRFEAIVCKFISETFPRLKHLRPGRWGIQQIGGLERTVIARYEQYAHLIALDRAARKDSELAALLRSDYTITPDIVVIRGLESDDSINAHEVLVDGLVSQHASLREVNGGLPLLHASISCKWTIRSDRVQNARSEALNLIRNRKGRLPHIVVVTGEPLPSRLSAIALGTGDIDCVYHFALPELIASVEDLGLEDTLESLNIMVQGKRLKDISDLPLDLAI
jgi:NgoMIV restriction enzyme